MIAVIGLDPGGDTGIAWLTCADDFTEPVIRTTCSLPRQQSIGYVREIITDIRCALIVACEAYINYGVSAGSKTGGSNPESMQIGRFEEMTVGAGYQFVQFPTAIKKAAWAWGAKEIVQVKTGTRHERDACCHAIWAYRHLKLGKSMAPKVKRQKV